MQVNNGNRLWVDYVLDIPDDTGTGTNQEPLQVSFSIKGQSNGNTVYYLVKFYPDLSKIMYIEEIDASKVELAYNEKILGVGRHRGQILINYQRKGLK